MPSEFSSLSAREIESIAAYLQLISVPPVRRELPDSTMGPLGRALLVAGRLNGFLAAEIDHAAPTAAAPPPLGTIAYGRHTAALCTGCHGADLAGGPMPHGGPTKPPAANLTPHATGLGGWSEQDFIAALRNGLRPDGSRIDGGAMPLAAIGHSSDIELRSLWRFLRSLPPVEREARRPRTD